MSFFKKLFGRKEETKKEVIEEEKIHEVEQEEISEGATDQGKIEECQGLVKLVPEKELEKVIEDTNEEKIAEVVKETIQEELAEIVEEAVQENLEEVAEEIVQEELEEVTEEDIQEELEEVVEEIIEEKLEETMEMVVEEQLQEVVKEEVEYQEESPVEVEQEITEEEAKPKKKGLFNKLFSGLAKTRDNILGSVDEVLKSFKKIDEDLYEELEEALIMADFGVETTMTMMEELRRLVKERKITEPNELKATLQEIITNILTAHVTTPIIDETKPNVVLVIGVNGVGKTTTIGKLAHQLEMDNKKVVLAAADTFRAAAIEQLQIWADRAKVDLIKHEEGSDPASVVYDGIRAAKARKADVLICDTAGRLQNKANLMKELEKISRIIEREYPEAHKEVLIVLDATTGQNAISQVKVFKEAAKVDGIVLTKLDGTAKGGAIVGICASMKVPVKYIGVGEKIEDLQVFDPQSFAKALFHVE